MSFKIFSAVVDCIPRDMLIFISMGTLIVDWIGVGLLLDTTNLSEIYRKMHLAQVCASFCLYHNNLNIIYVHRAVGA